MSATITAILEPTPWMVDAACRGMNPDLFFPTRGASPDEARAVCGRCTVVDDCLTFAVRHRIHEGIWGGHSARERRPLYERVPAATATRPPPLHGTPRRYRAGCRCSTCRYAWSLRRYEIRERVG